MRNPSGGRKIYSLEQLLDRQPKAIRKHPEYPAMLRYYRISPRLRSLRIGRTCRSLLDRATVDPENLPQFYRTYSLPRDPFFPLFFLIKREYLRQRLEISERRKEYISGILAGLPRNALDFIKFLALYERSLRSGNQYPVWSSSLFPRTKKRAREYSGFSFTDWIELFRDFLCRLENRYESHTGAMSRRLLACFILEVLPDPRPPYFLSGVDVAGSFRRLSKLYHPDRGGDPEHFIHLKPAADILRPVVLRRF